MILLILSAIYLGIAGTLFNKWIALIQRDKTLLFSDKKRCVIVAIVATVFWPIVVPVSYLELLDAQQNIKKF
ncbi:MAG TPA: hypothetical protein DDZ80_32690 [Cyanobacteria bacterium UBA8803]|nr:hypothetical protein [Cyanobacteria bacterium UBA9273]HBL62957.1 hypothetical protein [Cyanobacteria bacterium UBA8803]